MELKKTDAEIAGQCLKAYPTEPFTLYRIVKNPMTGTHERVKVGEYTMRLLSITETTQCLIEAQKLAKDAGELVEHSDFYREAQGLTLICKALCKKEPKELNDGTYRWDQLFVDVNQMASNFSKADLSAAIQLYTAMETVYSPLQMFSAKDTEVWINRLSHPIMNVDFLGQLDWSNAPELILSLIGEIKKLRQKCGLTIPDTAESLGLDPQTGNLGTKSLLGVLKQHGMENILDPSLNDESITDSMGLEIKSIKEIPEEE